MTRTPKPRRRSIRLEEYDYSQAGAYFVTLCTLNRECLFGNITEGKMILNAAGRIVSDSWVWLARQYDYVLLDESIIMPNHLHGIIVIEDRRRPNAGGSRTAPTMEKQKSLGRLVGAFKTISTKKINQTRATQSAKLWQRNYYEHVIRNDEELNRVREYISHNPLKWELSRDNPAVFNS